MPDALSKVTIFFQATGGTAPTGWTETFWSLNADLKKVLNDTINIYLPKRVPMLGVGATAQSVRVSNIPPNRVSQVQFLVGKQGTGQDFTNTPGDDYDPTQVDLLLRVQDTIGKRRQFWLGGLPDSQTDQLLLEGIKGSFVNGPAFKQFIAAILASGYAIRSKLTGPPVPTFVANLISSVQPIMIRNRKRGRPFELFRGRRIA